MSKTILLVEDEVLIAMTEKKQLEQYGYAVKTVTTGEKAVEAVKTDPDIDLVLMDINLGDGIDGTQAAEIILANHDIPIVFVSSHSEREIVEKTEKITSYGYVVKSSSITVLDASIKMAFKLFNSETKLKSVYNELLKSDAVLKMSFDQSPIPMVYVSMPEEEFKILNPAARKLFGFSSENSLVGTKLKDFNPLYKIVDLQGNVVPREKLTLSRVLQGEVVPNEEYLIKYNNGDIKNLLIGGTPIFNNGEMVGGYVALIDISERKVVEEALRESEKRYRTILETAMDGYWMTDTNGVILDVNESYCTMSGYTKPELLTMCISNLVVRETASEIGNRINRIKQNGSEQFDSIHRRKDGKIIEVEVSVTYLNIESERIIVFLRDITERKKIEETLVLSETKYKALFENISDAIFIYDPVSFEILSANKATSEIYGYTNDELIGMSCFKFSAEVEKSKIVATQIKNEGNASVPCRHHKKKDGSDIYVQLSAAKVSVLGHDMLFTVCKDITDSVRRESELKIRQEDLLESQRIAHLGSWRLDIATNKVVWTDELYKMYGFDPELPPPPFSEHAKLFTAESWGKLSTALAKTSESGTPYELELQTIREDGSDGWMWVYGKTTKDKDGETTGLMGAAQDITQRKLAEELLAKQNSLLNTLMENLQIGVYMVEVPSGKPLLANEASFKLLGRGIMPEANASTLTKVYELYKSNSNEPYPNDELPLVVAMTGESKHVDDMTVVNPDGTRKMLEVFGSPIKDADSKIWASLVSFQDITNRKLAEEKIKTLFTEKELLLKEVHHRIKNNLNTISSLLSLQAGAVKEPSAAIALQDAGNRVRSMSILYDKLYRSVGFMDIAVKDYLISLVDEIISNFIYPLNIKVEKEIQDFNLDAKRLQPLGIIINELLTNIMKYAFKGRESGLIIVTASSSKGHVIISVQDDGNGIPESVSFENSTGFGLQLVQALTGQLKGTIRIERENGTKVVLEFEI